MSGSYVRSAFFVAALMLLLSISALISSSAIVTTDSIDDIVTAPDNIIRDFFHPGKPDNQVELNPVQELALQAVGMRGVNTTWANAGGSENNDAIYEMAYDSQGNIIICGSIFVDSQFGTIEVFTEGLGDILVASLSPNGTWLWAESAGTAMAWDECRGIAIDKDDNVYASGYILGNVSFGDNYTLQPKVYDGYVARVNATTGKWDWAMNYGGFDIDVGWDILVDDDLNIYVTGYYQNFTSFGIHALGSVENNDPRFFLAKYNWSVEDWDWAKSSSGNGLSIAFQMTFDQNGDIYVVGYNTGSETWNNTFTSNHASTYAGVVVKYDTDGNFKWGRSYGGGSGFQVYTGIYFNNIVIDSQNRVIVGGNVLEEGTVGSKTYYTVGIWDVLVVRLQSDGTLDWSTSAGGPQDDRLQALGLMPNDQVVVGGRMRDWMKMGNSINFSSITPQHNDAFIGQIDNSGYWIWGFSFGGNANDSTEAILITSDGYHIGAGYFSGSYTFGNSLLYATDEDIYVWKFAWDEDNDGVRDYIDNCRTVANQNQSDWDSDGAGDECETDDDNDLLHDVLDDCQFGYIGWNSSNSSLDHDEDGCHDDIEDLDDDNDGIFDVLDNCPRGLANWTSTPELDQDGDGCHDAEEDLDDDEDGIVDADDNCPLSANSGQENYDGDSQGDICDIDDDQDGVIDQYDDCPKNETNWTSDGGTDNDGDGCNDLLEDADDDNDGMLDVDDDCPSGISDWNVSADTDHDWDGCKNSVEDNDNDNDGVINSFDDCPMGTTNWSNDGIIDNDIDGCHDISEDLDDDNDGFPDNEDDCPTNAGGSFLGQLKGCADDDGDGWGDYSDAFPFDGTQWDDGDEDSYGDNPFGTRPDACPLIGGNSTKDRFGCTDTDGDGYSDPDDDWTDADGADALPLIFDQHQDSDKDGYGDKMYSDKGGYAELSDSCVYVAGNSTIDRQGCLDFDGDGYSDPDGDWTVSHGADRFQYESSQWRDSDGDGYGDNWGNATWNTTRAEDGKGQFILNAYKPDLCPDSPYEFALSHGCSPAEMPSLTDPTDDGGSSGDDFSSSEEEPGLSPLMMILMLFGGLLVVGLTAVIVLLTKKKPKGSTKADAEWDARDGSQVGGEPDDSPSSTTSGATVSPGEKSYDNYLEEESTADSTAETEVEFGEHPDQTELVEPTTVATWEDLPADGEYTEADDSGTVWYKTAEGEYWYRNEDDSWSVFDSDGS